MTGVYGIDLTAGCGHDCVYCPARFSSRPSVGARLPFDPFTTEALTAALAQRSGEVRTIVLSPLSDPLQPYRPARAEAARVARVVLERGIELVIMTRGRFSRRLIELLGAYPGQARVALGMTSLRKPLVRALEPRAASPWGRIRDVKALVRAGVPLEIRLEPLIPELTDTRENLAPLFRALGHAGASRVVAHYLFMHPAVAGSLEAALTGFGIHEALQHAFEQGPQVSVGSLGTVRNLPVEIRRDGLARIKAWGAEFGLSVTTGATQNPDLPKSEPARKPEAEGGSPSEPSPSGSSPPPAGYVDAVA
jgi:DNA repair photolyase